VYGILQLYQMKLWQLETKEAKNKDVQPQVWQMMPDSKLL
jgi:hypothetical protein